MNDCCELPKLYIWEALSLLHLQKNVIIKLKSGFNGCILCKDYIVYCQKNERNKFAERKVISIEFKNNDVILTLNGDAESKNHFKRIKNENK